MYEKKCIHRQTELTQEHLNLKQRIGKGRSLGYLINPAINAKMSYLHETVEYSFPGYFPFTVYNLLCFSQIEVEPTLSEISLLIILISEFEEYREQDN